MNAAYEDAIRSADRFQLIPHILLNLSNRSKPYLQLTSNVVRVSTTDQKVAATKNDEFEEACVTLFKKHSTWVYVSLPDFEELAYELRHQSSHSMAKRGPQSDILAATNSASMSTNNNRSLARTGTGGNGSSVAKTFYLISDREIRKLIEECKQGASRTQLPTKINIPKAPSKTVLSTDRVRNEPTGKLANWSALISETIPAMISLPSTIREKMIKLAKFLRSQSIALTPEQTLIYPDIAATSRPVTVTESIDYPVIESSTPIIDLLLFFATSDQSRTPRPRELTSLCIFLIRLVKKYDGSPMQLFHPDKLPSKLLSEIRSSYATISRR